MPGIRAITGKSFQGNFAQTPQSLIVYRRRTPEVHIRWRSRRVEDPHEMLVMITPTERRRRARLRRILRLTAAGKSPREIADDPRVKLTPRRVRQILARLRDAL